MNGEGIEILDGAMPLIYDISDNVALIQNLSGNQVIEGVDEDAMKEKNEDAREFLSNQTSEGYRSKWSSSEMNGQAVYDEDYYDNTAESIQDTGSDASIADDSVIDFDDLPDFADEECKELSRQIKILEKKRDDAAKHTQEHRDRVTLMKGHLNNVRQEIVHTNGLLAAKQKEIDTEKHLIALADREKAAILSEIRYTTETIREGKDKMRNLQSQIYLANEELDKLKLSLNWNQEELEQWATAAAKQESDNLALQKFQRADEVKIKDLTLKLENLTKLSVEKQAELENEKTETQSKHLEIDRVTKLFKANHEERRQLVQQWQKTVDAMKERDQEIDKVSVKYREVTGILDIQIREISAKKEEIFDAKVSRKT